MTYRMWCLWTERYRQGIGENWFNTDCGHVHLSNKANDDYVYCPYCGEEIDIVEFGQGQEEHHGRQ